MDIFKEMGESQWDSAFRLECQASKDHFKSLVRSVQTDLKSLQDQQNLLAKIRASGAKAEFFTDLSQLESKIQLFSTASKEWEKEGQSQIIFTSDWAKPLNSVPYLLPATAIFKKYIFPFFAVLLPLIAWILPFAIIRFVFGMPMTLSTYKDMMLNMWLGGKAWSTLDLWGQARILFQTTWTVFGLFQSIQQPIQQALHIQKMDAMILEQGQLLQRFVRQTKELFSFHTSITGKEVKCHYLNEIPVAEPRETYAYVQEHPNDMKWIWKKIAELEVIWKVATAPNTCFPAYVSSKTPFCLLKKFYDPNIPFDARVYSDILIQKARHHIVVTGPNKGGKSSVLRAVCLNIWLAQTVGVAFADEMSLAPFSWIRSGLRLVDTPGSESLFERELLFATEVLRLAGGGQKGIVFYDECFHSTNPPDGEKTARLFLQKLWASTSCASIISTHVFGLLEDTPTHVQKLCVPAEHKDGKLHFSFQLKPGICRVSSVEELYKKHGFLSKTSVRSKVDS